MIDCYSDGGQDKKLRVWVTCEICGYSKFIKHFSIYIIRYNSVEVCNKCWTYKEQKTTKVELGNKIIKILKMMLNGLRTALKEVGSLILKN